MEKYLRDSSKKIFSHPRLSLIEDSVTLPDGTRSEYLLFDGIPSGATIVLENDQGEILVNQEYVYPSDSKEFQFPGGAIDAGETPEQAVKRELKEETGIVARDYKLLGSTLYDHRRSESTNTYFTAKKDKQLDHEKENTEIIEHFWIKKEEVHKMILEGKIKHVPSVAAWFFYTNQQVSIG